MINGVSVAVGQDPPLWFDFHEKVSEVAEIAIVGSQATESAQSIANRIVNVSPIPCISSLD